MDATNATLTPVVVLTPADVAHDAYLTHVARCAAGRVEAAERLAALALDARKGALVTSDARARALGSLAGKARKDAGRAWSARQRDGIMAALDGATVACTMARVGRRVLLSGLAEACGETVAVKGEARVLDASDRDPRTVDVSGATVTVKLTRRMGASPRGVPHVGFDVEAVGVGSLGFRVSLKGRVLASKHVRVLAASL